MAGVYGEIDSRNDFHRVLHEAQAITAGILRAQPKNDVIDTIARELDAMQNWTAANRKPTRDERKSIDVGLRAARELEPVGDTGLEPLIQKLYALNNYFEDWPSDAQAGRATDDDYFDSDD